MVRRNNKVISVVMGAYNSEKYISEAIESILNQTYKNFEFIIIDDCSTDKTNMIIRKYAVKDNRIKLIKNSNNMGLTYCLNKGIKIAKGKYIARMDTDDIALPSRLEKQFSYLENHKDVVVLGSCAFDIDENGKIIQERNVPKYNKDIVNLIKLVDPMIHPTVMFRKKEINIIGNYNKDFKLSQDYELWFRCVASGYKMQNLPDKLLYYRIDNSYLKRKIISRYNELRIKWKGYKELKLPIYKRYGVLISIIFACFANSTTYKIFKYFDPRNNK